MRPDAVQGYADLVKLPPALFKHLHAGRAHPSRTNVPAKPPPPSSSGWPVVVFSHGTWGCAEMYTSLCRSLASLGYVVVALEHEDGSGAYACTAGGETVAYHEPSRGDGTAVDHELRAAMINQRVAEVRGALDAIEDLGAGEGGAASADRVDERTQDDACGSLSDVLATCDVSARILMGHSFGAATCVLAAQQLESEGSSPPRCTVLLDTWAGALSPAARSAGTRLPTLSLESELWSEREWGIAKVSHDESLAMVAPTTRHQSFSDSMLWIPKWLARRNGCLGPTERRHDLHRAASSMADAFARGVIAADDLDDRGSGGGGVATATPPVVATAASLLVTVGAQIEEGMLLPAK